jgi:hypothetical protein
MREWMVDKQFDETMIKRAEGATTPLEIFDKLEDWTSFSWFAMSMVSVAWKNTILKSAIEMAMSVRYLMSSDAKKILDDLKSIKVAQMSDPKFLKRLSTRSEKIFIKSSEESSVLAKAMVREFDPEKFKDLNLQFARSLADQLMQVSAFLASTPGLPPKTFWFNLSMASEILDRILRCMDKEEIAKTMLRELVRSAITPYNNVKAGSGSVAGV